MIEISIDVIIEVIYSSFYQTYCFFKEKALDRAIHIANILFIFIYIVCVLLTFLCNLDHPETCVVSVQASAVRSWMVSIVHHTSIVDFLLVI